MPDPGDRPPTVLVIEADEPTRLTVTRLLAREDFLVLAAAAGRDAIAVLRDPLQPIDVVLLDVHLPDVDGVALLARLREFNERLPVIVWGGEVAPEEVARLVELGVRRFFRKPVSAAEILAAIEAALP